MTARMHAAPDTVHFRFSGFLALALLGLGCDRVNRGFAPERDAAGSGSARATSSLSPGDAGERCDGNRGTLGCQCFGNGTCGAGLLCSASALCVSPQEPSGASGHGDAAPPLPDVALDAAASGSAPPTQMTSDSAAGGAALEAGVVPSASGQEDSGAPSAPTASESPTATTGAPPATSAPPATPPPPALITSGIGAYWQTGTVSTGSGLPTVTVDDGQWYQTWSGFGGAFSEQGWERLSVLSQADADRALQLLFNASDGAGFVFGRLPIGASDYANDVYTLDDTSGDYALTNFSIARDLQALVPFVQSALGVNPDLQIVASPWTPPPWMKTNNAYNRGSIKSDAQTLGAYANYFARFVEAYAAEGIGISAVIPQNDPGYEQDYPSCLWDAATMTSFIGSYLGPTFESRGLDTQIWLGALGKVTDDALGVAVLANPTAANYVHGTALQWEGLSIIGGYTSEYQMHVAQSQHKVGNYPWLSGYDSAQAPNDHAYALESWQLIRDWIEAGANSYFATHLLLDSVGRSLDAVRPWNQNSLLVVDLQAKLLKITPAYYVFRHVSQYVRPGAVRLATQGGDALAFRNPDGSITTILFNSSSQPALTTLSVRNQLVSFTIPGEGWATVNTVSDE